MSLQDGGGIGNRRNTGEFAVSRRN